MTAPRVRRPVSPAADPSRSGDASAPQVPAVSAAVLETPVPADAPAGRPTVRLSDFGDVLTDQDLAALMQRAPSWPRRERDQATVQRRAPYLPARIEDGRASWRYRKVDVESWMRTGSSARVAIRRVS